jgi:hypothetical protein
VPFSSSALKQDRDISREPHRVLIDKHLWFNCYYGGHSDCHTTCSFPTHLAGPRAMDVAMQNSPSDSSLGTLQDDNISSSANDPVGISPPQDFGGRSDTSEKKKLGRKGRTKSRTGCFNCKKARIKVCRLATCTYKETSAQNSTVQRKPPYM